MQEGPGLKLLEAVALCLDIQKEGRKEEREGGREGNTKSLLFRILFISKSNFSDQPYVTLQTENHTYTYWLLD